MTGCKVPNQISNFETYLGKLQVNPFPLISTFWQSEKMLIGWKWLNRYLTTQKKKNCQLIIEDNSSRK